MSGFDIVGPGTYRPLQPLPPPKSGVLGGLDGGPSIDGSDQKAGGFSERLTDALEGVQSLQDDVKGKTEALARGDNVELTDLMISMGKSDVAFNLMLEVRNKLLEAWESIQRSAV